MKDLSVHTLVSLALIGVVLARGDKASSSRPLLSSHDAVQKRLADPNLRLLDVRARAEYDRGHIPGALWVDTKAAQTLAARQGGLTDRTAWEAWMVPLGIEPRMEVLVYDGKRQLDAARIWWLLRYLGVDRAGLIDGNFPLWQRLNRPVSTEPPVISARRFPVTFRADRYATRDDVLAAPQTHSSRIIDARSQGEYSGMEKVSKRSGHIPDAWHLEWSELVDKDGQFISHDTLQARLGGIGINLSQPVITHCQGGGRASVNTFALERLGLPTRNYYLGWSDWGNVEDTPVTTKESSKP